MTHSHRAEVLGVPVDLLAPDQVLDRLDEMIRSGSPHLVVTADSSGIVQAQSDRELLDLYHSADLVTPDSTGVVWALRRAGHPISQTVSGVDLVDRLCSVGADRGYRIFLLGAAPGVAEEAGERLRAKYPGCPIVGCRHGYFQADDDLAVAQEVALAKPNLLFVAMGIPRQEKFIRTTMPIIRAGIAIGVGGSLDVHSGRVKRAPRLIRRLRLEWAWRTILNPKKMGKAMNLPRFVLRVLREKR